MESDTKKALETIKELICEMKIEVDRLDRDHRLVKEIRKELEEIEKDRRVVLDLRSELSRLDRMLRENEEAIVTEEPTRSEKLMLKCY